MTPDELKARISEDGVEFIYAMFVEMHGKPCAKLVPVSAIDDLLEVGAGFAGFAAGPLSQTPADPDVLAIPDPSSYTQLPWQPNVAALQCDATVEGELWPYAPRVILQRVMEKAAEQNLVLKAGVEAEYSLLHRNEDGSFRPADERDTSEQPCYDARGLTVMLDHLTTVSRHMDAMGWGNYANDHEDANGQFEMNWDYDHCLVTADRHTFFKFMVKTIAEKHGLRATFMPKPFENLTGNGCHAHISVWDGKKNKFLDKSNDLGLSKMAYNFLGGVIKNASSLSAFFNPTINSYRRINAPPTKSGATWSPSSISYTGNNRTHMIRIPDKGRFELRLMDGSANPYLLQAGIIAAGLEGINKKLNPGKPLHCNMYEDYKKYPGLKKLPNDINQAISMLKNSKSLSNAFGSDVIKSYIKLKNSEIKNFRAKNNFNKRKPVSQWEKDNTLDC